LIDGGFTGDCNGDTLTYDQGTPYLSGTYVGQTCATVNFLGPMTPGTWYAQTFVGGTPTWTLCQDDNLPAPSGPSNSAIANSPFVGGGSGGYNIFGMDGVYNCATENKTQSITMSGWGSPQSAGDWFLAFAGPTECYYDRFVGTAYPAPNMHCDFPLESCGCAPVIPSSSSSSSSSSSPSPSSSSPSSSIPSSSSAVNSSSSSSNLDPVFVGGYYNAIYDGWGFSGTSCLENTGGPWTNCLGLFDKVGDCYDNYGTWVHVITLLDGPYEFTCP